MNRNVKRIVVLSRKEFLHIWRDPRTLMIVFMMPVIQLVMFGYAFQLEIQEIPLAVIDDDGSTESRRLVEAFGGSDIFRLAAFDGRRGEITSLFETRKARAVLVVPNDFERRLLREGAADVQILIDASDPNAAVLIRNYCGEVIAGFNGGGGREQATPFEVRTSILFNPDLKSSFFFVPGIIAMIMVMICALLTSITISREKETGTMEQMLVSPVRPHEIILGKVLPYLFIAFLDGTVVLLIGIALFGLPFRGSVLLMMALSTLYIVTALSLGLLISTQARTQQVAMMLAMTSTLLPTIMLSGLVFPIESMPRLLQYLSYVVPAKYFLLIIRGVLLKGSALGELWRPVLCLFIMTAALLVVSVRRFGMNLER